MKHTKIRTGNPISAATRRSYKPHHWRSFKPNRFSQDGDYINLTTTVTPRVAALVKTEAAINNKSVSAILFDILEQRYRLVD